jgi:thioesterase domain-containing protein
VPIQPRGSRRPLFCVQPAGGLINCYLPLSRHLGEDQPVYGLRSYGSEGGETLLIRLEDMASKYISEMREVQPVGPYQLLGYSLGASLAYEIAQQLRVAGEQVRLLAMIDGTLNEEPIEFFADGWEQEIEDWEQKYIMTALAKIGIHPDQTAAMDFDQKVARFLECSKSSHDFPSDVTPSQFKAFMRLFATNTRAQLSYEGKPYSGPIDFFACNNGDIPFAEYGWGDKFMGSFRFHTLPGNHDDAVTGESCLLLAEKLKALLEPDEF